MTQGIPIYVKVLAWLGINVLLLTLLVIGFLRLQFHMSLDWMLFGPAGEGISMIGEQITAELSYLDEKEWPSALEQYDHQYGVSFALFNNHGSHVVGSVLQAPKDLMPKLTDKRSARERESQTRHLSPSKARRDQDQNRPSDAPPKPRFMQRTGNPARYWAGIHLNLTYGQEAQPLTLLMVSDSITGGGLFVDLWPWLSLGCACLLISAFLWLPFVRSLTRSIHQLNRAAHTIAHGRFEERVSENRKDELGELATSVNAMAGQLGDYVRQQRRITADVAHELCSPIARMQMALGIVEQRSTADQTTYLKKLDGELQHMAKLVEEVLAFSKAETLPEREAPERFHLRQLIHEVMNREAPDIEIRLEVDDLEIHTLRSALNRALGNVLRNAVRYASNIEIKAGAQDDHVYIQILDQGPGVPPETLPRLFQPFYRPEAARGRNTGGSGLGLAIVKRCIEACGGTVAARLHQPTGLVIEMLIPKLL